MATPKTSINIHPKLFTGLLVGLAVAAVTGIAGALDPSLFSALGVWQAPAFSFATTGLAVLGGWLKGVQSDEQKAAVKTAKAAVKVAAQSAPLASADPEPAIVSVPDDDPADAAPPVALPEAVPADSGTQSSIIVS